ncbi:activating transcription factor 7-interacting protein 2 isoform X2 [Paroedura picta]|uniref:activating transcription factor 7-interacting protein 2 isoform X2 n=1 Tax=Paroedura picta TaxID=143630 RepID=UPI0040571F42
MRVVPLAAFSSDSPPSPAPGLSSNGGGTFGAAGQLPRLRRRRLGARDANGSREVNRMEAENKESQGLKKDPETNVRKPWRARKTMNPSSRKQVETLKNLNGLGRAGSSSAYGVGDYVQLKMIERERVDYSSSKGTEPGLESKEASAKEPVAKLVVNSEISIYNDTPGVGKSRGLPYNGCSTDTTVKPFLSAGSLRDLLCTFVYDKEPRSPASTPAEERLCSRPAGRTVGRSGEQAASLTAFSGSGSREGRSSGGKEEAGCTPIASLDKAGTAAASPSDKSRSGLEKVRCLIQSHVDTLVGRLDHRLQELSERIDHAQCLRKHEEITNRITRKISRLDRHVNSIADLQKAQLSKTVNLQDARPKTTILNTTRPLPSHADSQSVPAKRRSGQPGEVPAKTARSSAKETCLSMETSGDQGGNSTAAPPKKAPSNAHISAEAPIPPKAKFLIDLTEEEDNAGEAEVSVKANPPSESTAPDPPQPTIQPPEESPAPFPHLPPLPEVSLPPLPANSFRDTLPPQKLELSVAQVQNPKGIALQWNVREVDPRCAPIESFHLFICLESQRTGTRSSWIKTNEIKAMPLPMACSLSQFTASGRCYFAMQSKDVFGRFGPFCDIQSISAR